MRDSMLQERVNGKVRCNVCERRCLLVEGGTGWCRTRRNQDGRLVTLIYGAVSSTAANPIEKKPFYHFHPGTHALTAGSWSCNFGCPWCQNWDISKTPAPASSSCLAPLRFVQQVRENGCQGTSISFNEPSLSLEWSLDVFALAHREGLYNTFVTNGYMTPEALNLLIDAGLDGANVDVKGDAAAVKKFCRGIDVEKVWASCRLARSRGVHLEITTLVIPGVNDSVAVLREIAERIVHGLGPDVPWHVSRYYPEYRFSAPATPVAALERARKIGKEAGLEFTYIGNVPGHHGDNTYCPACGFLLVQRVGFEILEFRIRNGCCPRCLRTIAGVWQ